MGEKKEDDTLMALKMEEGTTHEGIQLTSRSWEK